MEGSSSYDVICTGEIKPGYDVQQVQENFAQLLKIDLDKAKSIIGTKRTLKKGLDSAKAKIYQRKLEDIGLTILLKADDEIKTPSFASLSLEPTDETPKTSEPTTTAFACPKCGLEQVKAEQCIGCGVYVHKVKASESTPQQNNFSSDAVENDDEIEAVEESSLNTVALLAASGAALLGALLWMGVAIIFGYEHGLVAWIVGGAVGFAAATFGGRGQSAGIICAVLAFVAIFAGKYFAYQSFQANWSSMLSEELQGEELQLAFEQEAEVARQYIDQVYDDSSMRQYIVDNGYTEYAEEPSQVTSEEFSYFKESVDPFYRTLATNSLTYEQWVEVSFGGGFEEMSTIEMMKEDFGMFDILFLFLGLGTAFRLGSGQDKN